MGNKVDTVLTAVTAVLAIAVASVLVPTFANAVFTFWTEIAPDSHLWRVVFGGLIPGLTVRARLFRHGLTVYHGRRFCATALRGQCYYELQVGPAWTRVARPRYWRHVRLVLRGWDRDWHT